MSSSRNFGGGFANRQRNLNAPWRQKQNAPQAPSPPLGEVLAVMFPDDIENACESDDILPRIRNVQYLASYNWLNGKTPSILIPGETPAWTPLSNPTKLREDSGQYFREQNAARYPNHLLEPAIYAVLTYKPEVPLQNIDIVACGSTLGNLLRFARGAYNYPFRMLVKAYTSTGTFEVYTTWGDGVIGPESHQRVTRYDFGDMICLVHFEADGCLPGLLPKDIDVDRYQAEKQETDSIGGLLSSTNKAKVSSPAPNGEDTPTLKALQGGNHIPQSAIFDLKTRSTKKKNVVDTIAEELPRLWISQTPNFILAYHTKGVFYDIHIYDVRDSVKKWEETNQEALVKFAVLLRKMVSFARSSDDGKLEIILQERSAELEIREQCPDVGSALSSDIAKLWNGDDDGSSYHAACSATS